MVEESFENLRSEIPKNKMETYSNIKDVQIIIKTSTRLGVDERLCATQSLQHCLMAQCCSSDTLSIL